MTNYLFAELLAAPELAASFDPLNDSLNLQAPANGVSVRVDGTGLLFTTAMGAVVLPMTLDQVISDGDTDDNILCTAGRLVVGEDLAADSHVVLSTAGDQFHGLGGDDSFTGGVGADIAYGNKGTDYLIGAAGDDTLYGGQNATGIESVQGGVGNDLIYGNLGLDDLNGNTGDDIVYGGQGADTIMGADGNDLLHGNRGADIIYGNRGADTVLGGPDGDLLYGGQGSDLVTGGSGDDTIYGNLDNDILRGETGADSFYGGQGDDWIVGGAGDDLLLGNKGSDTMIGNTGADHFVVAPGNGGDGDVPDVDVIVDFDGAADRMTIQNTTVTGVVQQGADVVATLASGDSLLFTNATAQAITTALAAYLGANAAPTVAGALSVETHEDAAAFALDLLGGAGDADGDALTVTGLALTSGGATGVTVNGTSLQIDPSVHGALNSGESTVIGYSYTISDGRGGAVAQIATITIQGRDEAQTVAGGTAADTLVGGSQANLIYGYAGDDLIYGGDGDDTIYGGPDDDVLYGYGGNDLIYGNGDRDTLVGGSGDDILYGGTNVPFGGSDFLLQGPAEYSANNFIQLLGGGAGADTLVGGSGLEFLAGGSGADVFVLGVSTGTNMDQILDFEAIDRIYLSTGYVTDISANIVNSADTDVTLDSGDQIRFYNTDVVTVTDAVARYIATVSTDSFLSSGMMLNGFISFNDEPEVIDLSASSYDRFQINALGGDDMITGGTGNLIIDGGTGNDTLNGTLGSDMMYGQDGADRFVYTDVTHGNDFLADFDPGTDILDLDGVFDSLGVAPADRLGMVQLGTSATGGAAVLSINHAAASGFVLGFGMRVDALVDLDGTPLPGFLWLSDV